MTYEVSGLHVPFREFRYTTWGLRLPLVPMCNQVKITAMNTCIGYHRIPDISGAPDYHFESTYVLEIYWAR